MQFELLFFFGILADRVQNSFPLPFQV